MFDESVPIEPDHDLLRPRGGASETAEREVVHQLVREDQLRRRLQALRDLDPLDRVERPASAGTGLDRRVGHVQVPEVVDELSCQRAVARSHLRHAEGTGFAEAAVQIHDGAPEQLGEHGVDVRARHEMTIGTDRWLFEEASRTVEREFHVFGEGDGAVVPDRARDGVAHVHGLQGTGSWVASNP